MGGVEVEVVVDFYQTPSPCQANSNPSVESMYIIQLSNYSSFNFDLFGNHLAPMFPFHPVEEDKAGDQTKEEASDDHEHGDDGGLGAADVAGVPDVVLGQTGLAPDASQTGVIRAHGGTRWVLVGEPSLAQLARWEGFCHLEVILQK